MDTFTGLCMPKECNAADVQHALQILNVTNAIIYDYPKEVASDGLLTTSWVVVGIWLGVVILWSIVLSCREPANN